MPQWRKLHVKASESYDIQDMPDDFTRLLWVMLPLGVDREGRGLDNPSWIKSKVMPLRVDVTLEQVEAAVEWYSRRGMIRRYSVDGRCYFQMLTFKQYQGNTNKEAESSIPPPPEVSDNEGSVNSERALDAVETQPARPPDPQTAQMETDQGSQAQARPRQRGLQPSAATGKTRRSPQRLTRCPFSTANADKRSPARANDSATDPERHRAALTHRLPRSELEARARR